MDNANKIQVAKRFINLHKFSLEWHDIVKSDAGYLTVYANLREGVYGFVQEDLNSCDYAVEISREETVYNHTMLFEWDD